MIYIFLFMVAVSITIYPAHAAKKPYDGPTIKSWEDNYFGVNSKILCHILTALAHGRAITYQIGTTRGSVVHRLESLFSDKH